MLDRSSVRPMARDRGCPRVRQFAVDAGLAAVAHPWEHPNNQRWLMITRPDHCRGIEHIPNFLIDL